MYVFHVIQVTGIRNRTWHNQVVYEKMYSSTAIDVHIAFSVI